MPDYFCLNQKLCISVHDFSFSKRFAGTLLLLAVFIWGGRLFFFGEIRVVKYHILISVKGSQN